MMSRLQGDNLKAATGLAILVLGTLVFFLYFFGVIPRLLTGGLRTVRADFASTGALHTGEPVRIDGVDVGTVKDIELDPGGHGATVNMQLENSAGPMYANASASIRWRTLLGASYAVALDRGTPGLGELGSRVIPQGRTTYQVELDEVTGALTASARQGMRQIFHELPKAFSDPGQPSSTLQSLTDQARRIAKGFAAVRGQDPNQDVRELVANTARAMQVLDAPQQQLRTLVQAAALTTQTTAARGSDLQQTISVAAAEMPRVQGTLTALDTTLSQADPLLVRLKGPAGEIGPTVAALRPVVSDADRLLSDKVLPLVRSLDPTASSLASTATQGAPLLDALAPSLERIDTHVLPDLARVSPESKHTTYEMIGPALAGLDGIGSHYDNESTYLRFTGNGSGRVLDALPCRAYFTDPGSASYLQCQAAGDLLNSIFGPALAPPSKGTP